MMRLLFLCLLLLLPAAAAVSEDVEGSADDNDINDDEDFGRNSEPGLHPPGSAIDKATGVDDRKGGNDNLMLTVIIVAVAVLTLCIAAIITIFLVRRKMHNRQQGIYSVPTEQDQKGAI